MTPTGRCRQSTSSSVVRSIVKILGPTNFRKRVEIPFPLLCPGVWNDIFRLSARLTIASKRGVLYCRSGTIRRAGYPIPCPLVEGKEGGVIFNNPLLLLEVSTHVLREEKRHLMSQAIVIPQVRPDPLGDEAIDG